MKAALPPYFVPFPPHAKTHHVGADLCVRPIPLEQGLLRRGRGAPRPYNRTASEQKHPPISFFSENIWGGHAGPPLQVIEIQYVK